MPGTDLHRDIVDVLLAEYDRMQPPDGNSGYPTKQLACVWGLYCEIHRLARAATVLMDNNMSHESGIMARVMMEHTVLLHWIIERGDDDVDALLANQAKRMKTAACAPAANGTTWIMTCGHMPSARSAR
jgi:hypothetical protein